MAQDFTLGYGQLSIGLHDWNAADSDDDEGGRRLLRLLVKHSQRFVGGQMDVEARYSFDTRWTGRLGDTAGKEFAEFLSPMSSNTPRPDPFSVLKSVVSDKSTRRVLVSVLQSTVPTIAAPIYIGKARSLRSRLAQHHDQILRLHERVSTDPEFRNRLPLKPRFADRAVSLGFTPSLLHVFTWDLSPFVSDSLPIAKLARLANGLESLLNRWHKPLLGRK